MNLASLKWEGEKDKQTTLEANLASSGVMAQGLSVATVKDQCFYSEMCFYSASSIYEKSVSTPSISDL